MNKQELLLDREKKNRIFNPETGISEDGTMNRKQRRAKGVEYVSPISKKFKAEDIIATTMYIPMIVLRDKYGFGRKRLGDFLEEIIDQMKFIEEGYVTTKDMQRTITEETGIRYD